MFALAVGSLIASTVACYIIGYAFIAPRDSFVRSRLGMSLLVFGSLSLVTAPPQLAAVDPQTAGLSAALGGAGIQLTWPAEMSTSAYLTTWAVLAVAGVLVGARIWNARKPGWPRGTSSAWDSSAMGRARGLLPMADSLDDVFDTLRRTGVDSRGVDSLAEELRAAGRRCARELPQQTGAVYRHVVGNVGPGLAEPLTRYLLEGAGRACEIAGNIRH